MAEGRKDAASATVLKANTLICPLLLDVKLQYCGFSLWHDNYPLETRLIHFLIDLAEALVGGRPEDRVETKPSMAEDDLNGYKRLVKRSLSMFNTAP